ncbi:glycosyltransferase [Microbacterium sp. E-13]|uniref:glycosyltransferase n=1 Tax=Microbacterium sp. E-13 TaxID=3404048 RepID=UPI003CE80605
MTDLVVVSLEAWDKVWRRNQHLVSRILQSDPQVRALFVEPPADPLHDLASRRRPSTGFGPVAAGFGGRLMRFRPVKGLPRRLDPRADERLARAVRRAAADAGMRHPLLWLNDPRAADLARSTGWPTLYDLTDDWLAAERPGPELDRIRLGEEWLLSNAAAVVACSAELVRRKAPLRDGIHLIPNAVDVAAYRTPRPRPADLPPAAAVYVGTLHRDRLDLDVCVATARAVGDRGRVVLVGPNAMDGADTRALEAAGVLVLGARPHDDVVAYLQHADVLLVPHAVTPFTDSLDPIKLYEYAAVGRPVVSTPVAGFRDATDPRVRLAAASVFPDVVASLLPATSRFPEGAGDGAPDWDDRAAAMRAVLDGMLPR